MLELDYLREIVRKYDAHYLKGYFNFTLKDFADRMDIAPNSFTQILQGKRNLTKKHEEAFKRAFQDLQVVKKTKDFVETESQKLTKELYHKRNLLTIIAFGFILLSMVGNWIEYIYERRVNKEPDSLSLKLKPIVNCIKQLAIGIFLSIDTAIFSTIRSKFLSLNFNYEK